VLLRRDDPLSVVVRVQHQGGVPRIAGENLSADMKQIDRTFVQLSKCFNAMPALRAQIARHESREAHFATCKHARNDMRKQHVAEIVPVERAEQHDG
jgi:hypothetical protein